MMVYTEVILCVLEGRGGGELQVFTTVNSPLNAFIQKAYMHIRQ